MNQVQVVNQNQVQSLDPAAIQKVLLHGDLSGLTPDQKNIYYMEVCRAVGLNHLTKPFDFIKFQGKEVMYANKGCAEQLRNVHKIGLKIVDRTKIDDVYVVTAEALGPDGRTDSSTGAVNISGLKGEALANAMMKAETKSKRRVTLSICGLNMLDETEVETIPGAQKAVYPDQVTEEDHAEARLALGYTFPFGTIKMMTPEEALKKKGPEELARIITLIEAQKEKGEPYKNQTFETMNEAIRQIEKVLARFENGEIENE